MCTIYDQNMKLKFMIDKNLLIKINKIINFNFKPVKLTKSMMEIIYMFYNF